MVESRGGSIEQRTRTRVIVLGALAVLAAFGLLTALAAYAAAPRDGDTHAQRDDAARVRVYDDTRAQALAWLSGCWALRRASGALVEEQWSGVRGGTLVGWSRTTRGERTVEYEHLLIFEREGKLVYAAMPARQQPTEFTETELTDARVVFENAAHDFPQRVIYTRVGADSVHARVEGERDGRVAGLDFPYRRVSCATGDEDAASEKR